MMIIHLSIVGGGEIVRDNYLIKMLRARGTDKGVHIRYRKNLKGITFEIDYSSIVTRVKPKGYDGMELPEKYVDSLLISHYVQPKISEIEYSDIKVKQNSDDKDGYETLEACYAEMRNRAKKEFENGLDKPSISAKVDFIELSKTIEYKEYKNLEKLCIGDTIHIDIDEFNLEVMEKVIATNYNPILDKYISFELGKVFTSYTLESKNYEKRLEEIIIPNALDVARQNATNLLTTALGGYVTKTRNELFIADNEDINKAEKIWRWNINGLGYSNTGVKGPFETAITADGQIVANFITVGQMNVARIEGLTDSLNNINTAIVLNSSNIGIVVNKQNDVEQDIAQMIVDINQISQKVSNIADLIRTATGSKTITIEDAIVGSLIELRIIGNNIVFDSLILSDDLILSDETILNGNSDIMVNGKIYDLGMDEVLRKYEGVYDEYVYSCIENTAQLIRRIGVNEAGELYVLENEVVENLQAPEIQLVEGKNNITIPNYIAKLEVTYVVKNEYTNMFATKIEMNSSIEQTAKNIDISVNEKITTVKGELQESIAVISLKANEIDETVKQKVGNQEIIASINLAIKNKQGIVALTGNQVTITSDYFKLTADGRITATAGTIGGWNITQNYLSKNYTYNNSEYQSGLYCPSQTSNGTIMLYAGAPLGGVLSDSNFYITHDGNAYARNFNIISDGALNFWYDNGKIQATYNKNYVTRYNDDGGRWIQEGRGFQSGVATSHCMWIYNAQFYQIQDGIHSKSIVNFKRINDDLSSNLDAEFYSDIHVWGTRQTDGITNSIYIRGYEVATNASDERLKENIEKSKINALDRINQIEHVSFDWKKEIGTKEAGKHVDNGYIAQEMEKIAEKYVDYNKEFDTYQINLLGVLQDVTKAMQELSKQNRKIIKRLEVVENGQAC